MTALARGGNLPWNTATAMVRPTTAAMAKIRPVIPMALPLHTSYDLYVAYSAAAARLQGARYSRHPRRANVSVAVATLLSSSASAPVVAPRPRAFAGGAK